MEDDSIDMADDGIDMEDDSIDMGCLVTLPTGQHARVHQGANAGRAGGCDGGPVPPAPHDAPVPPGYGRAG